MKKILKKIILIMLLLVNILGIVVLATTENVNKLKMTVSDADESYQIYILLPKKYILYAIEKAGLEIEYDKANTLIYNSIPGIQVDINNVQEETYIENKIEYVQILLDDLGNGEYYFEIIGDYTDMDMLYRVKSQTRDNIIHIDNFELKNNTCKIEYNYEKNIVKATYNKNIKINIDFEWWQILLIIILVIFIIYLYKRREK